MTPVSSSMSGMPAAAASSVPPPATVQAPVSAHNPAIKTMQSAASHIQALEVSGHMPASSASLKAMQRLRAIVQKAMENSEGDTGSTPVGQSNATAILSATETNINAGLGTNPETTLVADMVNLVIARQSYQANLQVMKAAHNLTKAAIDEMA